MVKLIDHVKNFIFVPKCKCCGKPADKDNLCDKCRREMVKQRLVYEKRKLGKKYEMVTKAYGSYLYKGRARDAVTRAKFTNPARFLNSLLTDISIDIERILLENNIDIIMAVPCHKSKLYRQEYDLPDEMAKRICAFTGYDYSTVVAKTKNTGKQHNLSLNQRKVNLYDAFRVVGDVVGKNILIIDDVITTGITVSTIATELKMAGAKKVYVWVYTYNT